MLTLLLHFLGSEHGNWLALENVNQSRTRLNKILRALYHYLCLLLFVFNCTCFFYLNPSFEFRIPSCFRFRIPSFGFRIPTFGFWICTFQWPIQDYLWISDLSLGFWLDLDAKFLTLDSGFLPFDSRLPYLMVYRLSLRRKNQLEDWPMAYTLVINIYQKRFFYKKVLLRGFQILIFVVNK